MDNFELRLLLTPSVGADSRVCPALPANLSAIEGQVLGQTRESAPTEGDTLVI